MTTPETPLPVALPDELACHPCPFCGGQPHLDENGDEDWHTYWLQCVDCLAETAPKGTEAQAVAAWNRRPLAAEALRGREVVLPRKVYPQGENGPAYYVARDIDALLIGREASFVGWWREDAMTAYVDTDNIGTMLLAGWKPVGIISPEEHRAALDAAMAGEKA